MSETKTLIAVEFEMVERQSVIYPAGFKHTLLMDPESGRFYEPVPGWEVTCPAGFKGLFREINSSEEPDEDD